METTRRIILAIVAAAFLVFAIAAIRDTVQQHGLTPVAGQVYNSPVVAKAEPVVNPETVKRFQALYHEYLKQKSLVKTASANSRESELAQLHKFFVWDYLGEWYQAMNPAEQAQVRDLHEKLPIEWELDYMNTFNVLGEQSIEVWEKMYREDLNSRGIFAPGKDVGLPPW